MLKYLKEHIMEEIDGAMDYMTKAIEHKGTNEGCTFRMMSNNELEHATALTSMFRNTEKPSGMTDAEYAQCQKDVLDKYVDSMSKIESMKKLYNTIK